MKFFKHFTDSHRGRSMQAILDELGHDGHSSWWILVEMCAEKLHKKEDEEYTAEHCRFVFNERFLRSSLRLGRAKVERILNQFSTMALLSFEITGNEIRIHMPKLLECMDRDAKRARPERGPSAPKRKSKRKKESKSVDQQKLAEATRLAQKYTKLFPGTTVGSKYEARFLEQIQTDQDLRDVEQAMGHYRLVLDQQTWRDPKTTFETFLGTERSGYFWRQFIEKPNVSALPAKVIL